MKLVFDESITFSGIFDFVKQWKISKKSLHEYFHFLSIDDEESISKMQQWLDDSTIQYYLAISFLEDGTDVSTGMEYLEKSADSGHGEAGAVLADILAHGEYGVDADLEKALKYYIKACNSGKKVGCKNAYIILRKSHTKREATGILLEKIGFWNILSMSLYSLVRKI